MELIGRTLYIALLVLVVAFTASAALEIITFSERDEIDE
jgi:hypothetical protein